MITIVSAKPTGTSASTNPRHHTRAERLAMVEPLLERSDSGFVPVHEKRFVARLHGVSLRTIERALIEASSPEPPSRKGELPKVAIVRTAMLSGNKWAAHQELVAEGLYDKSYPTFCRRLDEDKGLKLSLTLGEGALQRYLEYGTFEPARRNELWYSDAMHIPLTCRGPRGEYIDNLYLLSLFDAYSRHCIGHIVKVGDPDADDAALAFFAAVVGRGLSHEELVRTLSEATVASLPLLEGERPPTC